MSLELWLAFVVAASVMLTIPGPTILLVVTYALSHGRRSAVSTVLGVMIGDVVAMVLSLAGLGALMAVSSELFTAVKWIGAAYLVYLGIRMWRSAPAPADRQGAAADTGGRGTDGCGTDRRMVWHAFAVTVLNPKSITFFVAFLPQFMEPAAPVLPQLLILGITFQGLAFLVVTAYALLAGDLGGSLRRPGAQRLFNRFGGSLLVGAGLFTALRRTA